MDNLKKEMDTKILGYINEYKLNNFKVFNSQIYNAFLEMFKDISSMQTSNDKILVLKVDNFEKVRLKENILKVYMFCGSYFYKDNLVSLLREIDSFKYYICDDINISRQLAKYPIGIRLGLEKHSNGINMSIPTNENLGGLFEDID